MNVGDWFLFCLHVVSRLSGDFSLIRRRHNCQCRPTEYVPHLLQTVNVMLLLFFQNFILPTVQQRKCDTTCLNKLDTSLLLRPHPTFRMPGDRSNHLCHPLGLINQMPTCSIQSYAELSYVRFYTELCQIMFHYIDVDHLYFISLTNTCL